MASRPPFAITHAPGPDVPHRRPRRAVPRGLTRRRRSDERQPDDAPIDLNADLGEGFGRWRLTDDEAAAVRRHQRQRGLRLPRRGRGHHAAGVRAGGRARGADRRPGLLPGPGGLRAARDGRAARRAGRRGGLPDRRPGGLRPRGGLARVVRQAARRALQPRRARRGAGRRRSSTGVLLAGADAARARPARLAAAWRRPARPGCRSSPRRSRTARTPTEGTLVPRGQEGAVVTDPDAVVARSLGLARDRRGHLPLRGARRGRAPAPCACTATPRARSELARRVRARLEAVGRPGGGVRMRATAARCRRRRARLLVEAGRLAARRPRRCTPSCCAAARRARCSRARDRPRRPHGAPRRPRRPGPARRRAARLARSRRSHRARGEAVEIPVRYDGPDLAEVAALWGVAAEEVARIHAGTEFRVAFCGFAPGFGYLTGLPGPLRRAAPGHPAYGGPGGLGGARGPVHRRLPALLARRLAADRHDGRRAVGPRARAGRAAVARAPGCASCRRTVPMTRPRASPSYGPGR